ncbi:MAG: putative Ig domain-containing protein [Synergistaceae bacterium]|nr:putative Ig domain-containing protein [Synergistaceae bacterium]
MRSKFAGIMIVAGILCGLCVMPSWAANPEYMHGGAIPSPIDRSDLWKNPPRPAAEGKTPKGIVPLPVSYDLRQYDRVGGIRSQSPWNSCWSFAATAAAESSWMTQNAGTSADLAEFHVAYFVYGDPRTGYSFSEPHAEDDILDQGGNADQAIALFSRIGTVSESVLPYPTDKSKNYTAPSLWPESYDLSGIYLKEAYTLGVLSGDEMMNTVKNLIVENGAVDISYYAGADAYASSVGGVKVSAYFDNTQDTATNHSIVLIGWDDNFAVENFSSDMRPSKPGAWLARNSWGDWYGEGGYFWISYEQYMDEVTAIITESRQETFKLYDYSPLGNCGKTSSTWAANVFKTDAKEILKQVSLYTVENNQSYEIYVYDLGTSAPSSPTSGTLLVSVDVTSPYAGYHTVSFDKTVTLEAGHYFSVVMNGKGSWSSMEWPLNWGNGSPYAEPVVNAGESYFSSSGTSWNDGAASATPRNACLKAFTVPATSSEPKGIKIDAEIFPDETFRAYVASADTSFDKDQDGYLTDAEIAAATSINVRRTNTSTPEIASLKGIELFTSLESLDCYGNLMTSIDLSINTALKSLDCALNKFTSLDVSKNTELVYLNCSLNHLTALDFSWNKKLTMLDCSNNDLTALNVSGNADLKYLSCGSNQLKALDVSANTALTYLDCSSIGLVSLDVSNNVALTYLNCFNNQLTALDLDKNTQLDAASADLSTQNHIGMTLIHSTDNFYYVSIPAAKLENVSMDGYDKTTGLAQLAEPGAVTYYYDTKLPAGEKLLHVTLLPFQPEATIVTGYLPDAAEGKPYTFALEALGYTPITWTMSGAPEGLTVSGDEITGTPTASGSFDVTITASNDTSTDSRTLKLSVNKKPEEAVSPDIITSADLGRVRVGRDLSITLEATGTAPITWTADSLPGWLTLSGSTLSGKPTAAGTFTFTVKASNEAGESSKQFTIVAFTVGVKIATLPSSIPEGKDGERYSFTFSATSSDAEAGDSITWTLSGKLPAGLAFANGSITGTPSEAGSFDITVTAALGGVTASENYTLVIRPAAPVITTNSLPSGKVGESYNASLAATGTKPVTWSVEGLPEGLTLDEAAGTISGVPSEVFSGDVTVRVENSVDAASKTLRLVIVSDDEPEESDSNIPLDPSAYDETAKDTGIAGLSVKPRFAMPRDVSDDVYGEVSVFFSGLGLSYDIHSLVSSDFLASRDAVAVFNELKAALISEDTPQLAAVILPRFTVHDDAVYVFRIPVDNITRNGTAIFWHAYKEETAVNVSAVATASSDAKASFEKDGAIFMDDSVNFANVLSGDEFINAAVYLKAGTYAPVIAAEATSEDVRLISGTQPSDKPDPSPDSGDVRPDSGDVRPDSGDVRPDSGDVRPDSGDVRPDSGDVRPDSGDVRPDSRDVRPDSGDVNPESRDVRPESRDVRTESGDTPAPTVEPKPARPSRPTANLQNQTVTGRIVDLLQAIVGVLSGDTEVVELPDSASGTERESLSPEEEAAIPEDETPAIIFPVMQVTKSAVYVWAVDLSNLNVGDIIILHMFPESDARNAEFSAAEAEEDVCVFVDDDGNEVTNVPASKSVNAAAYMEAGTTYAPVVTTASAPETSDTLGSNGGGCSSVPSALALLALLFLRRKER